MPSLAAATIGIAAIVLANAEALRAPFEYRPFTGIPRLYALLEDQPHVVLAEVPFYPRQAVFENAEYVLNSTAHWRPLMNGYSGYTPASYVDYANVFWYFPRDYAIDAMKRAGVTHVMAMEMQELQKRGTDVVNALNPLNAKVTELGNQVSGNAEIPADVKASFDQLSKDLAAMMPRFVQQGGRGGQGGGGAAGGGRGGAANDNVMAQVAQAKTGLMGGMWPGEQTMKAYTESKAKMPKAIAEANALIAKAQTLSTALTKYNITLPVTTK